MDENYIKKIPIGELRQEDGASDLASSPDMEPYLNYIIATMQGGDGKAELETISGFRSKNDMCGGSLQR